MTTEAVERLPTPASRTERAVAAIRERAAAAERRQTAEAVAALEAAGGLTDGQRTAVEQFAARLVDRLLAPPTASLRAADPEDAAVALDLFDARATAETETGMNPDVEAGDE